MNIWLFVPFCTRFGEVVEEQEEEGWGSRKKRELEETEKLRGREEGWGAGTGGG